jgi:hypothetical protein
MTEGHRSTGRIRWIPLGMAGCPPQPGRYLTTMAEIASGFFPVTGLQTAQKARADLAFFVRKRQGISSAERDLPTFRGSNQFVHADYGRGGAVWFDFKARAVSENLIADAASFAR